MTASPPIPPHRRFSVVLSATARLSFMPAWKGVALAFSELGAGAFFLIGTVAPALGPRAVWAVLAACLLSIFVRSIDIECWAQFIPGGLAGRVEQAFGSQASRLASAVVLAERLLLSALVLAVVGHYVADVGVGAIGEWRLAGALATEDLAVPVGMLLLVVLWARARQGRVPATDVMATGIWFGIGTLVLVCGLSALWLRPGGSTPWRLWWTALANLGPWTPFNAATWLALLAGAGLALPALGGGDVLARVARELPPPRVGAMHRTGLLVALVATLTTVLPAMLFTAGIPVADQRIWADAPLASLAHLVPGPGWLQDLTTVLVLVAAFLALVPAANAALADAARTLRGLAGTRALPEALAQLHRRYGTPARAIDAASAAIVLIILVSGGRVPWLAGAYGMSVAATVLLKAAAAVRYRRAHPGPRPFLAPFNLRFGGRSIPIGLLAAAVLMVVAVAALLASRSLPSIAAIALMAGLTLIVRRRPVPAETPAPDGVDAFDLLPTSEVALGEVEARPGNVLVAVRNPHGIAHLGAALAAAGDRDVIVMTVRLIGVDTDDDGAGHVEPSPYERSLFSQVISIAERSARSVRLLIVPAHNVFDAVVATAVRLRSSEVYVGESSSLPADDQARILGEAWERADKPADFRIRLVVLHHSGRTDAYHMGAHPPALSAADLDLIHRVWLDATNAIGPHVHHHDVVRAALTQMEQQLKGPQRDAALAALREVARPADELAAAVHAGDFTRLRDITRNRHASELAAVLTALGLQDQVVVFRVLPRRDAAAVFEYLAREDQDALLKALAHEDVAALLSNMAPDDRTMFLEELPAAATRQLLSLLAPAERSVALTLLGYPEGSIGRLMTPNYVAVREDWTIREVLDYIRTHGQDSETLNVVYVVDERGLLIDDIRIRELLLTSPDNRVADLMDRRFVALKATAAQREAVAEFRRYDRSALPVTDTAGMLIGIVTIDDVLDVAEAAATSEIQRIGGSEALDEPYTEIAFWKMIQKRAGWLTALFLGEMLTATAMGVFEAEIARAVVLALFVPLIISSGGNSGSQASTLVIRALALGEVGLKDWWKVMRREVAAGLALGGILGSIGFLRITIWSAFSNIYGVHSTLVAITVALALVGIVLWGTLIGSLLPFLLRRLGFDPATSSAPFVATLVDVTGLVIYFSVAMVVLRGTLL